MVQRSFQKVLDIIRMWPLTDVMDDRKHTDTQSQSETAR